MENNKYGSKTNKSIKEGVERRNARCGSTGGMEKRANTFSFMTSNPPSYLKPPKPPKQPKQGNWYGEL